MDTTDLESGGHLVPSELVRILPSQMAGDAGLNLGCTGLKLLAEGAAEDAEAPQPEP